MMSAENIKEKATKVRDLLNTLISIQGNTSQEDAVINCALACAVEELEKWIYNGEFLPSVRPVDFNPKRLEAVLNIPNVALSVEEWAMLSNPNMGKIQAIKSLHDRTGLGLVDCKAVVEAATGGENSDPNFPTVPSEPTEDEKTWIKKGERIFAIKNLRGRTGMGLKEAKAIVDKWADEYKSKGTF
jgi:ribosomal protein L7/L12